LQAKKISLRRKNKNKKNGFEFASQKRSPSLAPILQHTTQGYRQQQQQLCMHAAEPGILASPSSSISTSTYICIKKQ
jgi:hypothetical protein